jgi:ketosteroid isomerase-like protein
MARLLLGLCVVVFGAPVLLGQSGVEQAILTAEHGRAELRRKGSVSSVTTTDFVRIDRTGALGGRQERAADPTYTIEDLHVRPYGDVALVIGRQVVGGSPVRFTRVWVKQAGKWLVASQHTSPLTNTQAASLWPPARPVDSACGKTDAGEMAAVWAEESRAFRAKDVTGYSRIVGDDYIRIGQGILTKPEFMKVVGDPQRRAATSAANTVEQKVRFYGNGCVAVLTLRQTPTSGPNQQETRRTRVYVRRGGRWQEVLVHITPVAQQS